MEQSYEQLCRRIDELEFQLAHQQRLCEQLNEVVTEHTHQLLRYQRVLVTLEDQLKQVRERHKEAFDPRAEKPPHY